MKVEVKKQSNRYDLHVLDVKDLPAGLQPEDIKSILTEYKKRLETRDGLRVLRGPFASFRPNPIHQDKVDLTIRAIVVPAARKRGPRVNPEEK